MDDLTSANDRGRALPVPLTRFIGRSDGQAALRALLWAGGVRLLTLTGPGGVGTTRLALQVANDTGTQFAHGVHVASLASIRLADAVLPTIAEYLKIGEVSPDQVRDHLIEHLAAKQLLLGLDNVEQGIDAGPDLAKLIAACPTGKLLITSREPLHITGEREFSLPPLPLPPTPLTWTYERIQGSEAVQLFVERARAVRAARHGRRSTQIADAVMQSAPGYPWVAGSDKRTTVRTSGPVVSDKAARSVPGDGEYPG